MREGAIPGGWALDDGVGLLFRGRQLERVVSSRPGAGAERADAVAGELVRRRIQPELLLGDASVAVLGGRDEAVEELRRVHRMRRQMGRRGLSRRPEPGTAGRRRRGRAPYHGSVRECSRPG